MEEAGKKKKRPPGIGGAGVTTKRRAREAGGGIIYLMLVLAILIPTILATNNLRGWDRRRLEESDSNAITVGAYYYIPSFDDKERQHASESNLRQHLTPPQFPFLNVDEQAKLSGNSSGVDDSENRRSTNTSELIAQHLSWSRYAGISMWAVSYHAGSGADELHVVTLEENVTIHDLILDQISQSGDDERSFKMALVYEKGHDIGEGNSTSGGVATSVNTVVSDMEFICDKYVTNAHYFYIKDRPVLFLRLADFLETPISPLLLEAFILEIRSASCGGDLHLVGDFGGVLPAANMLGLSWLDAVSNSDFYGAANSSSPYVGQEVLDVLFETQLQWMTDMATATTSTSYIPCISPGYNQRWRQTLAGDDGAATHRIPLSRRISEDADEGSLFAHALEGAFALLNTSLVDDNCLVMINSFNNWGDDTQVEPTEVMMPASSTATSTPENYTMGLNYTAYGQLYLDILRAVILPNDTVVDVLASSGGENGPQTTSSQQGGLRQIGYGYTGASASNGGMTRSETESDQIDWIVEQGGDRWSDSEPEQDDVDSNS
jgi:hypothetical protein